MQAVSAVSGRLGARIHTSRCVRRRTLRVMAFTERDSPPPDWRAQKMVATAHAYYHDVWNRGDMVAADRVLSPGIVLRDEVWADPPGVPIVGLRAFKQLVQEWRAQYPDATFDIDQMGMQDTAHLFVRWTCQATQMEAANGPASFHCSTLHGIDVLSFDSAREHVLEVEQFRQPTADEARSRLQPRDGGARPSEIKLARLHWEPPAGGMNAGHQAGSQQQKLR